MCGIFGIVLPNKSLKPGDLLISDERLGIADLQEMFWKLAMLSESRGKEAAGFAIKVGREVTVYKQATRMSVMLNSLECENVFGAALQALKQPNVLSTDSVCIIGHARLVTNGSQLRNENNQPVESEWSIGVHNGIIVNDENLWRQFPDLKRQGEVDTEVVLRLLDYFREKKHSLQESICRTLSLLKGAYTLAIVLKDQSKLILATNTGSLYYLRHPKEAWCAFGSERRILERFQRAFGSRQLVRECSIGHLRPYRAAIVELDLATWGEFDVPLSDKKASEQASGASKCFPKFNSTNEKFAWHHDFFSDFLTKQNLLQRCTKCILPSTFPFIRFNSTGLCNFCQEFQYQPPRGEKELELQIQKFRRKSGEPDSIVALSGGRDSCYGLHYVKKNLGLNPVAYTYDWGMVTDLARRNMARMCGILGVEHVIVSADINRKRDNIRKNLLAWLQQPELGMITLLMAGDKQFYYYANKLMKESGIELAFFSENPRFEKTRFKSGFCGVEEGKRRLFNISFLEKAKLLRYFARNFIKNPAYFNLSLLDSFLAYASAYFVPHRYTYLFDYLTWDENQIVSTLRNDYEWELSDDTDSTWRIGDGTAAFYNYVYFVLAGFTEHDTFRSNQIREGIISRDEALTLVQRDNQPRWFSMQWYADTIGFDLRRALKQVHAAERLW